MNATEQDIVSQIDSLQTWFASRPYGFREHATTQQTQQWNDREREMDYLTTRLEMIRG